MAPQGDGIEPDDDELDDGVAEDSADSAAPLSADSDQMFAAAAGATETSDATLAETTSDIDGDGDGGGGGGGDDPASFDPATLEGVSVYPTADDGTDPFERVAADPTAAGPSWGTPRLPPPGGQSFERRAPQLGPQPDEYGYYPDDYYLPTDWPRLITKIAVGAIIVSVLAVAGLEMYDRFAPTDDETTAEPTPTQRPEVAVYECAGDPEPVAQLPPPGALLIAGRTADSRWIAFANPEPPPLQLWVEARDVPTFVPSTVGIVSCATAPDEFPTPR